jgi:hypothetical protein
MPRRKLSDRELLRRLDAGESQAQMAKEAGVTRQAIHDRVRHLRKKTTKAIVAGRRREDIIEERLDSMLQLRKINAHAVWLLEHLMGWAKGDSQAIQVLENQVKTVRVGDEELSVKEVRMKDPRALAVQVMAEIRGQLDLQLELFKTMYSVEEAERFVNTLIEVIDEVAPDVRREIITRLNSRSNVRAALRLA